MLEKHVCACKIPHIHLQHTGHSPELELTHFPLSAKFILNEVEQIKDSN